MVRRRLTQPTPHQPSSPLVVTDQVNKQTTTAVMYELPSNVKFIGGIECCFALTGEWFGHNNTHTVKLSIDFSKCVI